MARIHGFTIVELLIVIVVIAILAAIVFIGYTGITARAHTASLESDLKNGSSELSVDYVNHGSYPATAAQAGNGQGLKSSPGNTLAYNVGPSNTSYCLQATNASQSYHVSNVDTTPQLGACAMVSTLAGNGTYGYVDGPGDSAEFAQPFGLAVDSAGNVYVADYDNNLIRKITPSGIVSTLAGNGTAGLVNGPGASAEFNYPFGVTTDSSGNIYVVGSNNVIRRVTPSGVVSTMAGNGTQGYLDGPGSSAEFNGVSGIAVDSSGNVYVADSGNNRIRKVSPSGVVSSLAGNGTQGYVDGPGDSAEFNSPDGVAVDAAGNVYVADTYNNRVRKITPAGVVSTLAGSGVTGYADGAGAAAKLSYPQGIAVDSSGNIYVVTYDNRIREITPSGVVSTLAGSGGYGYVDGVGTTAQFNSPFGVAVDSSGHVYVADSGDNRIRIIR